MPYEIETKDGIVIRGIPDDVPADHESVRTKVQAARAQRDAPDPFSAENINPAKDMGTASRVAAGVGKAIVDTGRGMGQLVGATTREDVAAARKRDEALMDTGAGMAGDVAGNIGMMLLPGGAVKGAGVLAKAAAAPEAAAALSTAGNALLMPKTIGTALPVGAAMGVIQPSTSTGETVTNAGVGGVLNAAAPVFGKIVQKLAGNAAEGAAAQSRNAVRDATLKAGQDAGYVTPPSAANPSWFNKRLESVAGKAAVGQEAAVRNQEVTNSLIRKEFGMTADAPISEAALEKVRNAASAPYREVAALPALPPERTKGIGGYPLIGPAQKPPADALKELKQARFDGNAYWKEFTRTGEVAARDKAVALNKTADSLETYLERTAIAAGKPDLVDALRAARQTIAKTHDVERALNTSTGEVDARILGRMIDKGRPLTGGIETAARFADAFPQYAREGMRIPTPGVSKSEALASGLFGVLGHAAGGAPGLAAAALPLISGPVRSTVLSPTFQRLMAQPNYSTGIANKAATEAMRLAGQPGSQKLIDLATGGGSAIARAAALASINARQ